MAITRLTADFFPMAGAFHLSLGLHNHSGGLSGRALPSEGIEVNDREYSPEEIGEFTARVWGRQTAPFVGGPAGGSLGTGPGLRGPTWTWACS